MRKKYLLIARYFPPLLFGERIEVRGSRRQQNGN
jgi:hypothetical protein